ncbi:tuberin isoform X2 [Aplysia californica]|uniref:Tuberin isoform X2 n=1 Tax=Aplysia californica TaxID=6500 RepID=A0ABM1VSI9_APLCA|nr:tuberin isoform X2 [Aplysia californica]
MSGAGKQSQKNEENFSKVKEKMQRLFGFGKPSTPPAIPKATTREVVFTTEILKEIGPESPANNRLRRIRELCEVVKLTRLEDNAVEALWGQISDLLQPQVVEENRHLALRFLHCLVEGQLPYLTIVRGHFFRVIQGLTDPADIQYRLQLFDTLSECGKNLLYFEDETGVFLQLWMPEVMSAGYVASFLPIILNVIKYNAAYVDEDVMAGLVQQTCMIPNRSRCDDELKKCLQVLDAVICYSYLPSNCLHHFVAALCHTVDKALFSEKSWELMRKLLGTYLGHSAIFTMCCMLQDKRKPVDILLLRGAIFFTGMALWGSRRVSTLKQSHSSVLPSFYEALSHENNIVAYEVVLNLQRLVSKYGKDLQHVTWEIVLDILQRLLTQIDKCGFERKVMTETHQVITSIENLYRNRQFFGPTARFFRLVEMCASKRPSSSVCALMDYQTQFIHPGQENWIEALNQLMERYLKGQTRTEVRKKSLEVLSLVLSINTHVYERELIEHIVLPHFSHCDTDPDPEVRCQSVDLLLGLCEDCHSNEFFELSIIVEKIVKKPLVSSFADSERKEEGTLGPEEASLIDVRMAILKIIEVFKVKLYTAPASHCQRLYELLISHLEMQYSHLYLGRLACQLRKAIFNLLLLLRADSRSRVGLADRKPGERHVYSPYVMCRPSEDMESLLLKSPSVPGLSPSQIYSVIEYEHTFKLFLRCLETERDWTVLHTVLEKLTLVLENKTMVLSASSDNELLDALCGKLCAMVKDRTVEQSKKLINRPPNFTRSDFHACVFPVLASMVTYHAYLDKTRQRELVNCLEFGLVSKCAKICVTTLRICSLEMKELMMRMLPAVLLSLSKISATISMAIPVLAFLSSIVRIPKLYANFVEDQYMSVFAIALPYTNPFKFSHYTVSLAHHVIGIWFIRCRLPFRQGFVKYIQRGLKYNVLQLFEENSIRHLSAHNQDSSDRGRTSSLNEGHRIRRRNISGIEGVRNDGRIPMDEKMSQFHKELTETCVDMMARYAYGNFTALPKRSPMAQFLLKDGQRGMWVVGNKIITITTSGGGAKTNNSGLCDKCLSSYLNTQDPRKEVKRSAPIAMGSSAGESRRRHKSMAALGRSQTQVDSLGISLECEEPRRSRDDMSLPQEASTDIFGRDDAAVQTGSSLTTSANSDAMDAGFSGPKGRMSEQRTFSLSQCSCWCTSWAEVNIRGASGVVCWMMRIENESSSPSFSSDPSAPDITQLLAPVRCKTPDSDSLGKIDSGSLCEEEYETLHSQHFSEAERRLFHEEPLSQTDTPTQDVSDSIQTDSDLQFQSPSNLRRISSSPSVLSGSQDTCQSPRELLRELVECTERERQAETATRVESLGSRARPEAQDFSHTDTTFPHSGIRERGSSGATADPDVLGTRNDPQQGNSSDGNAQSSSVICKSRRSGEKSSDLARQLSLEEESPTDVARLTKMTSQKSAESSDSVFHVNPALTGTSFPAGRVGHLASTSSDGKAMVHRSTSTGKSFEPKKSVQRTMSEDLAGKKRPEALNLLSSHTKVFDRAAVEDSPNESSTPSSLQDEVPELRQLKRRGHTISVMSPAGQVRHSDDYDGRLQSGGPKDAKGGLSPSYVFLQLYQCHPMVQNQEVPLRVPDNDKFRRTIDMLDHIYPYETHKIGVLYMGKGQPSDERTLLGNEFGSPRYTEFLQGLGQMISIEEAERDKIYLGGLNPSDGKFTVTWQDESLRVIFHIATLMPTMPGDTRFNNKKSHIGNDFVTIVYNDSSEDYKSGTISGQFNFVSIVIRPLDYESNAVSLITKEGSSGEMKDIADILGHTHTKIISDANLPLLVRQIAVHCNLASMVLQRQQSTLGTPEVFASNWLERLRQIKLLKRRIIEYQPEEAGGEPTSPSHVWPPPGASGDTGSGGCEDFTDYL